MALEISFIIIGLLLSIVGIVGCLLPLLPGLPLNYIAVLLLHFTSTVKFSTSFLIAWALIVIFVQVLDYYVPIWGTKKMGGGKKGVWGSSMGVLLGLFILPPWGLIVFPFLGAVAGELLDQKTFAQSIKAGFGSFLGFMAGTFLKISLALVLLFFFLKESFSIIYNYSF